MSTQTTNLGLVKPDLTDNADIAVLNQNADKIDAAVPFKFGIENGKYGYYRGQTFTAFGGGSGGLEKTDLFSFSQGGVWKYSDIMYASYTDLLVYTVAPDNETIVLIADVYTNTIPTISSFMTLGRVNGTDLNITKNAQGFIGLSYNGYPGNYTTFLASSNLKEILEGMIE